MPTRGLAIAVLLLLVFAPALHASIPTTERDALIAFYQKTGGPNWTNKTNWLGAPGTECTWFGVSCNGGQTTVLTIVLQGNNLVGTIPSELGQFPNMNGLALGANSLTGSIPPEISTLTNLQYLLLHENPITGGIPSSLSQLVNLDALYLYSTKLGGPIPASLGSLPKMKLLILYGSQLTGSIPSSIGTLSNLEDLRLSQNQLTGTIPPSLGSLAKLKILYLNQNNLTGGIPSTFGGLTALTDFRIAENFNLGGTLPAELGSLKLLQFFIAFKCGITGAVPPQLGGMSALKDLRISFNKLTGPLPPELGNLANLEVMYLGDNGFTGTIPSQFGSLSKLIDFEIWNTDVGGDIPPFLATLPNIKFIFLFSNRFSGPIPSALGNKSQLQYLWLADNALTGDIPSSFANLVNLVNDEGLDLRYNGLTSSNAGLVTFLESKQFGTSTFTSLQTVAPTAVSATATSPTSIRVDWTPIAYQSGNGGYQVEIATSSGGPFSIATTTPGKGSRSALVTNLNPLTNYFFRLSTVTYGGGGQKNTVVSSTTSSVSAITQGSQASVVLASSAEPISVLADGTSTATTDYTLTNVGQASTTITLTQNGSFFNQSPTSFALAAGASQKVTITSLPQAVATSQRGSSTPSGSGVPSSLVVPVSIFAASPPAVGDPNVVVAASRVDVAGPSNTNPSGSVRFRNVGSAPAIGLLSADVGWIAPDPALITINPGEEVTASFTVNRARRPDASSLAGTASATLSFVYLSRSGAPARTTFAGLPTLAAPVAIGDTVQPTVTSTGIPALLPNEIGLVVPGVGNITGSVGVFISDISIGNALSGLPASDLKIFYLSGTTTLSASQAVSSGQSLNLADVVSTVFQKSEQIGVLHLRSTLAQQLGVNASVFNKSNPAGTYGSAIPVFRTNRAIAKGETSMITGLRKTATSHTNLYLQEVAGTATTVDVSFLDAAGQTLGALPGQAVAGFATTIVGQVSVPEGSVTALISNKGDGAVVSYATPVDRSSGDTWAVTDWNRYFGRSGTEEQVIPVAGSAPGRNSTYFRTDITIANPGTVTATGTLRYYQQVPAVTTIDKPVAIEPGKTLALDDAVVGFFGAAAPSLGHVVLIPSGASLVMTSRTYTTVQGTTQTFGTGVPTMTRTSALRLGQSKVFGAVKDSTAVTTNAARPGTFRTNVGLVETEGKSVTVRVSILFFDGKQLASGGSVGAKSYVLAAHEFRQLNAIVGEVLGTAVREADFGDLDNVQVKVEVIEGSGGVLVYASSTDNGTGDTVLRIE